MGENVNNVGTPFTLTDKDYWTVDAALGHYIAFWRGVGRTEPILVGMAGEVVRQAQTARDRLTSQYES